MTELPRLAVLAKMFTYFRNAIHSSNPAKEYLNQRGLDHTITEVGYNSGQFHHGSRRDQMLIESCLKYGLLIDKGSKARTGNPAYHIFGKWGLVFPLKNENNQIVSLYFRSTLDDKKQRHFYLKDRQGLYPKYPSENNAKLILTESIIDAASLLEQEDIKSEFEILSLYGTNGLTAEHSLAIKNWVNNGVKKTEIIFFLNGDAPGFRAVKKYAPELKLTYPKITISQVDVPENEDVNSLLQGHPPVVGHSDGKILAHLIDSRVEVDSTSNEKVIVLESQTKGLDTENPYNLKYKGEQAHYQIKGFKTAQMDSLKITLQISKP